MMPDGSCSLESLLKFLKQAGMQGLINPAAARSRRTAVEQLAGELTEAERTDVRTIDVGELVSRFHKLEESSIRPETLAVYAQRVRTALEDFRAWTDDPASFRSTGQERMRALKRGAGGPEHEAAERITLRATENPTNIVPIPVRPERTVHVANLPLDLTVEEAERIARVIRAFADPDRGGEDES